MEISSIIHYEKYYDKDKYPVEPYEELVVQKNPHDKKMEIMGAWKTGCLEESSGNIIYRSKSDRNYSFTSRWKYNAPVARHSWEYIANRENVIVSMIPNEFILNTPEVLYKLMNLEGIGFVYAVFVLHCLKPEIFPLFDQHVMRAYKNIEEIYSLSDEDGNQSGWKWDDYVSYKRFFDRGLRETELTYLHLDRALWAYGKHLKKMHSNSIPDNSIRFMSRETKSFEPEHDNNHWQICKTLGAKEKEFFWKIESNKLIIKRYFQSGLNIRSFPFQELDIINEQMESVKWLPLANNVEKLGKGTEQWGVGRIITDILHRDPSEGQLASHICALFVMAGNWQYNGKTKGMMFKKIDADWRPKIKAMFE
jgi:hypothetical protein